MQEDAEGGVTTEGDIKAVKVDSVNTEAEEAQAAEETQDQEVDTEAPEGDDPETDNNDSADAPQTQEDQEREAQQPYRQLVFMSLLDWGVDEKLVKLFEKQSVRIETYPEFIDAAIALFPEMGELIEVFREIDGKELPPEQADREKGQQAVDAFHFLAKKMGMEISESDEKLAKMAFVAMAIGADGFKKWFKRGWETTDLRHLIDAIVKGADYNSPSMMRNMESNENTNIVKTNRFFNALKRNPEVIDKLLSIDTELSSKLNWNGGKELLEKAKSGTTAEKMESLQQYLQEMYAAIQDSDASNLVWQQANQLIADKVFDGQDMLATDLLGDLEKIHKGERTLDSFGDQ